MGVAEEVEIVIVGSGICGLATALALHRKGITSVVLERSDCLRSTGAGISILANGWRALDQLGVGSILRPNALPIECVRVMFQNTGKEIVTPFSIGEARCLKRSDLLTSLANGLPSGTIRFGCQVVSVKVEPTTSFPMIQLRDGTAIKAKVLIGCDGANSVVAANFLELKPTSLYSEWAVRGFTNYPNGHGFQPEFFRVISGHTFLGRVPITDKLVYWVASHQCPDPEALKNPELIRESTLDSIRGFPAEMIEMIAKCDVESMSIYQMRYREPWELVMGKFRKGMVTVAGDAMHAFCPFLAQGGSSSLEDAVVLARCLAPKIRPLQEEVVGSKLRVENVEAALDQYVKQRRMRVFQLAMQTYLSGLLYQNSSLPVKFVAGALLRVLFRNPVAHTQYECGQL